ncbi:DUF1523 domain-containing protein, partial [Pseudomonas syringae]|nr:DUF1523 domain-containing protein [Pseudomonas syringae]
VEAVTSRDQPFPVFNTIFFVVVGLLVVMVVVGGFKGRARVDGVVR